jgi:hypothetical protein
MKRTMARPKRVSSFGRVGFEALGEGGFAVPPVPGLGDLAGQRRGFAGNRIRLRAQEDEDGGRQAQPEPRTG